ncbi:MAG: NADH-quinone oxidoreductase subunit C [Candidatus Poribacteria bacterium]|nr:NADH-quinone oxidoreductase subunit C [Candidatus Poribacteria bacterium]
MASAQKRCLFSVAPQEIYTKLKDRFGEAIRSFEEVVADPFIVAAPESIADVAQYLAEDEELAFDFLMCLSGSDLSVKDTTLEVVYHLSSMTHRHRVVLKVIVPKENPHVPTVENIWKTANWHEREAYDLYGIVFDGHSDLRRILLPDDWEGAPLRKDYKEPDFYRGMRVPY